MGLTALQGLVTGLQRPEISLSFSMHDLQWQKSVRARRMVLASYCYLEQLWEFVVLTSDMQLITVGVPMRIDGLKDGEVGIGWINVERY